MSGIRPYDQPCPECGLDERTACRCDWDEAPYDDEECYRCHGEGGWHDCAEDCCCCLRPSENVVCPECNGTGRLRSPAERGGGDG